MTESSSPRVALVTGGSGGIGRASAERLAADGLAVAVHYAGNRARADEIVAGIVEPGGRAIAVKGDVAEEADMVAAFDAVEAEFGGLDVVVNTAGIIGVEVAVPHLLRLRGEQGCGERDDPHSRA